jgi:hypothetical protein
MGGFKDILRMIQGWWGGFQGTPPQPTCVCVLWERPTNAVAWAQPTALPVAWDESKNVPVLWDNGCDC